MPHKAFFNLTQEKQNKIIDCAYKEFSNNTYEKASIFLIAKKSEISRASFYCYFEDKEDIYKYLIDLMMKPYIEEVVLKEKKFAPFYLAKHMFDYFLSFYKTEKANFVITLLKNMNPLNINYFTHNLSLSDIKVPCGLLINKDALSIKNKNDILIISFTILSNMAISLLKYFENEISKKEAKEHFERTLEILEHGILKGGKHD